MAVSGIVFSLGLSGAALAQSPAGEVVYGQPQDKGLGLQPAATQVARDVHQFHDLLLWIITGISVFVLVLLLYVMVRYRKSANPTPKRFTHNVTVEVIWTVAPVAILVVIALFSFPLLFREEILPNGAREPAPSVTIKATGNTWNWSYAYSDHPEVEFVSNMLPEEDAKAAGEPYKLAVDEPIVVPVGETVRMLITSNDVIHSWTIPAFGIKEDAVPGRVNVGWFNVDRPGTYYGQCSELCGIRHAFMPIAVKVVSRPEYEAWLRSKGATLAEAPASETQQAAAAANSIQ